MRKTFDYWVVTQAQAQLDIEDIGNTCIQVFGGTIANHGEYILIIRTNDVGITRVLSYGPVYDEEKSDLPLNHCTCSYQRLEYDGYKVNGIIKDFLKNTKAFQAEEVEFDDIKDKLKNLADFIV